MMLFSARKLRQLIILGLSTLLDKFIDRVQKNAMRGIAMKSYRSPKVEIHDSSMIQGKGIFANKYIKAGEIVCVKAGDIFTLKEFKLLGKPERKYSLQIEEDLFLAPRSLNDFPENPIYINHSCNPNVGFRGQITYVALRDIEPGEELTHDYAMCYTSKIALPPMECACKSEQCRRTITCDDWKSQILQQRYGGYFVSFILRKIRAEI